jgi:predicted Fe-Mo cluster-binding NifX family protein
LDSQVDPRFGRARYFILIDTESGRFTAYDNLKNVSAVQGSGILAAQAVVDVGAAAVITGHVGPKAAGTLEAGAIRVYLGASGTVKEAVEAFQAGQLQPAEKANVAGHCT